MGDIIVMSAYFSQFEKEDTDSWLGKDYVVEEEIDEEMEDEPDEEEKDPFTGCMDDYGLSHRDFM